MHDMTYSMFYDVIDRMQTTKLTWLHKHHIASLILPNSTHDNI